MHIVHASGDLQALPKFCGNIGPSGLHSCHFCLAEPSHHTGTRANSTAYYPYVGYGTENAGDRVRDAKRKLFDPADLPLRSSNSYNASYDRLERLKNSEEHLTAFNQERTESGNFRPILSTVAHFSLLYSVPLDIMHLIFLNVLKRMLNLYTDTEPCCNRTTMESEGATEESRLFSLSWMRSHSALLTNRTTHHHHLVYFELYPKILHECVPRLRPSRGGRLLSARNLYCIMVRLYCMATWKRSI